MISSAMANMTGRRMPRQPEPAADEAGTARWRERRLRARWVGGGVAAARGLVHGTGAVGFRVADGFLVAIDLLLRRPGLILRQSPSVGGWGGPAYSHRSDGRHAMRSPPVSTRYLPCGG